MKKKLKKSLPTIILLLILVIGLSLLLYPSVSNYIYSIHQTQSVADYCNSVLQVDNSGIVRLKEEIKSYNKSLSRNRQDFINGEPVGEKYKSLLNIDGSGMIGYITIDKIGVQLPIFHGTSESVLSNGVGHLEGSSLPFGGNGTHCVLTGHRGVPISELFSNLDDLDIGDIFTITVLDEVLTYEVDKISIVAPDDDSQLYIDDNQDYVTLLTCTPYAVNSHRLLVKGKRITNNSSEHTIIAEAVFIDSNLVAIFIALPILAVFILIVAIRYFASVYKIRRIKSLKPEHHPKADSAE